MLIGFVDNIFTSTNKPSVFRNSGVSFKSKILAPIVGCKTVKEVSEKKGILVITPFDSFFSKGLNDIVTVCDKVKISICSA